MNMRNVPSSGEPIDVLETEAPKAAAARTPAPLRGKDEWTRVAPTPRLRLPRTQRELFELLAAHDPEEGLRRFVLRLDCSCLGPADIHRIVVGTGPADAMDAVAGADFDPRAYLSDTLLSNAFRATLPWSFLSAFPEKRRDVLIHIPKTAGTDLTLNLWPRRVFLPAAIDRVGSNEEAVAYCARLARLMPATVEIVVHGHIELGRYLAAAGARLGDRFFATVREPLDMQISQISNSLTQLLRDQDATLPQTREWLRLMELDRVPTDQSPAALKELWRSALLNPRIAPPPNLICRFLSKPGAVSYERAMSNAVAFDVELTTTREYSRWLSDRWGIASQTRHNASRRLLSREEVEQRFGSALHDRMAEDRKFYAVVAWAMEQKGTSSISGIEIAKLAGTTLFTSFPDELLAASRS